MQVNFKTFKPIKAFSKDHYRPNLQYLYLDRTENCLVATDSYVLIRYPIELEDTDVFPDIEHIYLSEEIIKYAEKFSSIHFREDGIHIGNITFKYITDMGITSFAPYKPLCYPEIKDNKDYLQIGYVMQLLS